MKLLAKENIPLTSVKKLDQEGIDVKAIGIDNPSISDEEVIQVANQENRTIVTFDSDYSELIYLAQFIASDAIKSANNELAKLTIEEEEIGRLVVNRQ
jgi:predicted nuclease of predicted toxin-antitoxin system